MIKIGIRAHDFGKNSASELARLVYENHFDGIQLVLKKAIDIDNPLESLFVIKEQLNQTKILMFGAYFNPIHPNSLSLKKGIDNFERHLRFAKLFDCEYVGTETGSLMGDIWGYLPKNHTETSFKQVLQVFSSLVKVAKEEDVTITIEGAYAHVVHSPKVLKRLVDKLDSSHVKVTLDLYNFLNIRNYRSHTLIFDEAMTLLKDKIVIYHLKDFSVEDGLMHQVGLGKGLMDYPYIIGQIKKHTPNAYLIFEGVTGEDISSSFEYIKSLLNKEDSHETASKIQ